MADFIDPVPQLLAPYRRPGATEAVELLLLPISERMGRAAYELWSAATHGTPHGLLALATDGDHGITFYADAQAFISTIAAACVAIAFAYTNRLVCSGADASDWANSTRRLDIAWKDLFAEQRAMPNQALHPDRVLGGESGS